MSCTACNNSDAWHRRQMDHLEETIGPRAVHDFEQEHPERERDERPRPTWLSRAAGGPNFGAAR